MNVYGLVGEKIQHSFSPTIHQIIMDVVGLDGKYNIFEIEKKNIDNLLVSLKTLGIKGVNITIPYKENAFNLLSNIDKKAKEIGAINTIYNDGRNLIGFNTDYYGIIKTFEKMHFNPKDKTAIILGSGGAGKAVKIALLDMEIKEVLFVTRRNDENLNLSDIYDVKKDIIINATPVGMFPNVNEFLADEKIISNFKYAMDLIYNPLETKFIKYAKKQNIVCENGLYMLVMQAIRSQEIWNDIKISDADKNMIYKEVLKIYN